MLANNIAINIIIFFGGGVLFRTDGSTQGSKPLKRASGPVQSFEIND